MKKLSIKISILLLSVISITSCSDDFIDVESGDVTSGDFFNTEADYQNALIGAYDLLQTVNWFAMLSEIASDNTLAGGEKCY